MQRALKYLLIVVLALSFAAPAGAADQAYYLNSIHRKLHCWTDTTCSDIVYAGGMPAAATATFTTPSGATAYSSGQLIANSATAGSVVPLSFTVCTGTGTSGMVRRVRVKTPDTGFAGQSVRVHLYSASPTVNNGDHAAWLSTESTYIGYFDVALTSHFSNAEKGFGVPHLGSEANFECAASTQVIYGLIEARGAITPQGAKLMTVTLEVLEY